MTDLATLSGSNGAVTGTVKFFVCQGAVGSPPNCTAGGTQVGGTVTISGGTATSAAFAPTQEGTYCFRAEYTPDAAAQYSPFNHTNTTTECFTAQAPTLQITKTADAASVDAGSPIGFTITVQNTGAGTATNVTLNDRLPTGSGISWSESPDNPNCSITGNTLSCNFGNLASNASASVHVVSQTTAASCGTYNNTATASANNSASVQASASTQVKCPALTITKTADAASVDAGDTIGFTITVQNTGQGAATNATLNDPLPANPGLSWTIKPTLQRPRHLLDQRRRVELQLWHSGRGRECEHPHLLADDGRNLWHGQQHCHGEREQQWLGPIQRLDHGQVRQHSDQQDSRRLASERGRSDRLYDTNSQYDMIIKVLTGSNEGTIVMSSGCP